MPAVATAVPPLRVAIFTALEPNTIQAWRNGALTTVPVGVYHEGEVPRTAAMPYNVVGTATETKEGANRIGQPAQEQTLQVKAWAPDSWEAQQVYAKNVLTLDQAILTVTGHKHVLCQMEYLTDFAEPNPEVGGHVVVGRLRTRTTV